MFKIRPGIYTVPNIGRIDTRKDLSDEVQLQLYLCKAFPFISITDKAIPFLKKQKLDKKVIATMINRATSFQEIDILLKVKTDKTLKTIAETKTNALKL